MKLSLFKQHLQRLALAGAVVALTACGVVDQGNFAVEKHVLGGINTTPISAGAHPFDNVLDSYYVIYAREYILPIPDMHPKDKNGVLLKDMDLNVSYKVNPNAAPVFLRDKNWDLTSIPNTPGLVLGINTLTREISSLINETTKTFSSKEILMNQDQIEAALLKDINTALKAKFGDLFELTAVRISSVSVDTSVQASIDNIQRTSAQEQMAEASKKAELSRYQNTLSEMGPVAQAMKEVAAKTGVSVANQIELKRIEVLSHLNNVTPTVEAGTVSTPKP